MADRVPAHELDMSWRAEGNCVGLDPDIFFPPRGKAAHEARAICATCPVKEECLEFALASGEKSGIWGGLGERERRKLRRKRSGGNP